MKRFEIKKVTYKDGSEKYFVCAAPWTWDWVLTYGSVYDNPEGFDTLEEAKDRADKLQKWRDSQSMASVEVVK